jgi:hypothetical protein
MHQNRFPEQREYYPHSLLSNYLTMLPNTVPWGKTLFSPIQNQSIDSKTRMKESIFLPSKKAQEYGTPCLFFLLPFVGL